MTPIESARIQVATSQATRATFAAEVQKADRALHDATLVLQQRRERPSDEDEDDDES